MDTLCTKGVSNMFSKPQYGWTMLTMEMTAYDSDERTVRWHCSDLCSAPVIALHAFVEFF